VPVATGVFVTVGVALELGSSSGGSGKTAYSLGGPVSFSGSASSFIAFNELLRDGGARKTEAVGAKLSDSGDRVELDAATVGLVPDRFLDVVSCEVCVVTIKGALRSSGNEARSSPFTDGPEETVLPPGGAPGEGEESADSVVLTSVDPLPLRFRRR